MKTLYALLTATLLATPAFAQDKEPITIEDISVKEIIIPQPKPKQHYNNTEDIMLYDNTPMFPGLNEQYRKPRTLELRIKF